MTFTTLQYNGLEQALADWGIAQATREVSNQAHDHFACDFMLPADAADPIPYGAQIILRLGRLTSTPIPPGGLPPAGATGFSGGRTWFIGYRVETFRTGSPALEKMDLKFAGPWEFFFERLVFQKLFFTYNGTANVADWRSQVILGQSVNALTGPNDTILGTNATNLMSIRQQVAEIIAYVTAQTTADYGAPQIQSDILAADENGNFILNATYPGATFPGGTNLLIPDFIAGTYAVEGAVSAGQPQSGSTLANLQTVLRAPLDSVNDITCAEAMRRQLKWIGPLGEAVVWFDYSTTSGGQPLPTLHVGTRDQLPSVSLPMIGQNAGFKIKRRDDLIPGCVALKFRIAGTYDNVSYVTVINDIASTIDGVVTEGIGGVGQLYTLATFAGGSPTLLGSGPTTALQNASRDFAAVTATMDFEGNSNSIAKCAITTLAARFLDPHVDTGASKTMWYHLFPEWNSLANIPAIATETAVTITVDNPGGANDGHTGTIDADSGIVTIDGVAYDYLLTDGQVAPWMLAGNAGGGAPVNVLQCSVNAKFVVTKTTIVNNVSLTGGQSPYAEKTARVTLLTIPGGLYQTQTGSIAGEVIPYGLAGYIYGISLIPQYEGSFTIQETDITDPCPMGANFNISAGRAEWADMDACVQSISYDLTAARTTLTFGPAAHLGAKDLVERLRANRGPIRPYYGVGGNMTNPAGSGGGGTQIGNSVTQRGPSPGMEHDAQTIMPINLFDWSTYPGSYTTGIPGINLDSRPGGQPNYGNITGLSAPNQPTIHLQYGNAGAYGPCIRISTVDLIGANKQAWFQPVMACVSIAGVPTTKTIYVLSTAPE